MDKQWRDLIEPQPAESAVLITDAKALASIAISAKRIADALENLAAIQYAACPFTVALPHRGEES